MKIKLRELFLLVTIAGLAFGWWVDRSDLAKQLQTATRKYLAEGMVISLKNRAVVSIDLGSDDGVKIGANIEIFRKQKRIGRVHVAEISPDQTVVVGEPDNAETFQVGDAVRVHFFEAPTPEGLCGKTEKTIKEFEALLKAQNAERTR